MVHETKMQQELQTISSSVAKSPVGIFNKYLYKFKLFKNLKLIFR